MWIGIRRMLLLLRIRLILLHIVRSLLIITASLDSNGHVKISHICAIHPKSRRAEMRRMDRADNSVVLPPPPHFE